MVESQFNSYVWRRVRLTEITEAAWAVPSCQPEPSNNKP